MLFCGRDAAVRREGRRGIAFQRRLPAAADKSGIFGDDRGLRAGSERRRPERDGKQPNDIPGTRGQDRRRDRRRVRTVTYSNGNV
jgi:hypothetical protein